MMSIREEFEQVTQARKDATARARARANEEMREKEAAMGETIKEAVRDRWTYKDLAEYLGVTYMTLKKYVKIYESEKIASEVAETILGGKA